MSFKSVNFPFKDFFHQENYHYYNRKVLNNMQIKDFNLILNMLKKKCKEKSETNTK